MIGPNKESYLYKFVLESNKIEGIVREPTDVELEASHDFLQLEVVHVGDLEYFVNVCAPGMKLRVMRGMNVRVGKHTPPVGGPLIEPHLKKILAMVNDGVIHPYHAHHEYETLHPFMDGNGRSGRILWAWQMMNADIWPGIKLGFLHAWYYQALEFQRGEDDPKHKKPRD